ncbi:hypothetical protein [Bacteroides acidifaciens]|uniref:hypothetical protein n=1 Tax=Bacteroides acidifaciens TaxID=85831 RepID=UPI002598449E|nr:hypothetical protein [Bacteroides acidifaciens]
MVSRLKVIAQLQRGATAGACHRIAKHCQVMAMPSAAFAGGCSTADRITKG